jgi:glycosyltransferase involved in cell wall biosynthesis
MRATRRLLFVGTLGEPGGAASHFITLTSAMAAAGHRVGVVAMRGGGIWQALEQNPLIALYAATFTRTFEKSAMRTVRQAIGDLRPERVIAVFERDYWATALVAAQCGVQSALFLHHAGMKRTNKLLLPWSRQHFLVPSENLRQWLIARGVSASRTDILHNPIDTQHFRPDAALRAERRVALGLAGSDVLVGYVGRLETNKGVTPFAMALTEAMARVPAMRALWVGFGRREQDIDDIIRASPFADRHMRRGWTDDTLPSYAAMDILALPSTGREAFGRVLVEAQSCGIPVLGSDIGGISETMHAGTTGLLVAPGDVGAWANALTTLGLDAELRHRMGNAGRAFVCERFDNGVIVEAFERWLHMTAKA